MNLERMVADLVEKIEHRFLGKYRGFVVDNADPQRLGRLKLRIPSVLGSDVVSGWATPCMPYGGDANQGFLFVPEVGAGVWVEFEEGDLEFPIWVGTFWSKPGGDSELPKPNGADGKEDGSVQDPPTRKIIKTRKGHTLQFEDKDGEEMVVLVEATNGHVVTMNKDGIKIKDGANGHEIVLNGDGIMISDNKNGNRVSMDAKSGSPTGAGISLNEGDKRICLDGLIDWLLKHKHVGNMGAPTPLFPDDMAELTTKRTTPNGGILSDTVKAK